MKSHGKYALRKIAAKNIQTRRKSRGWSQEKLAEKAGLSRVYISLIETEKKSATLDAIEKIAASFDCPATELLSPHVCWESCSQD